MIFRLIGFIIAVEGVVFKSVIQGNEPLRPHSNSAHTRYANRIAPLSRKRHSAKLHSTREESAESMTSMMSAFTSILDSMFNNLTRKQEQNMNEIDKKFRRVNARLDEYINRTENMKTQFQDFNTKLNKTRNNVNRHLRLYLDKSKMDTKFYQDYSKRLSRAESSLGRLDNLFKQHDEKLNPTRNDGHSKMIGPNQITVAQLNGLDSSAAWVPNQADGQNLWPTQFDRQNPADKSSTIAPELMDYAKTYISAPVDYSTVNQRQLGQDLKARNTTLLEDYIERTQKMDRWHGDYHKKFIKVGKILQNISLSQRAHDHVNAHLERVSWLMESLILSMHRRVLALEKAHANHTTSSPR